MKKVQFLVGLSILFFGVSIAHAQGDCAPCEQVCDLNNLPFTFSGWVETGIYTNGNGGGDNGPMHTGSRQRTDYNLNQLYLSFEKEMNTQRGFDWGAKTDIVYGSHADSMQTCGDGTFDAGWGANEHGYSVSAYNVYGTVGYKDFSVKAGKFGTPIGWEASASKDNFFNSHSYCYWIEPATHMGVVGDYAVSKNLSLSAGWVTGMDSSFANPNDNQAVLTGFTYTLTDNATLYYCINAGKQYDMDVRKRFDYFVQSICFEWTPTKRCTYVMQYNLRNDNAVDGSVQYSSFGVNNHFLYSLNDQWGVGTRIEWLRENGGFLSNYSGDYYECSLGLNWKPYKNVCVRPETRYDWYDGAGTPFGKNATRVDQVTGGCGVVMSF
jgi:hypothetical protein